MARVTTFGGGIQGAAELEAKLMALAAALQDGSENKLGAQACRAGAKKVQEAARNAAPVGPKPEGASDGKRGAHHKISNNMVVKKGKSKMGDAVTYLVGTGHAFQAIFVDRGTIYQHANPFMEKALAAAHDAALAAMGDNLSKGIDRVARRNGVTLP